jgi:membrane-bound lytic murein transglycosylase B
VNGFRIEWISVLAAAVIVACGCWVLTTAPVPTIRSSSAEYADIVSTVPSEALVVMPTPAATITPQSITARVDPAWLDRVAVSTGIPRRALAAYAGASLAIAAEKPGCHLGWTTIAAIGHVESGDARHGGATLLASGYTDVRIVGPALDGGAYAGIHDSDGGMWDGDSAWDHAVGPFQFIPQTWRAWGADGNGDGRSDPNQIDDSAVAAARYLCHAGDLSGVAGWRSAVFSYNHLESYVDSIAVTANRFSALCRS